MAGFANSHLLLYFLMNRRFLTPFTILLELDLAGHELAVLARPIVRALAHRTGELEELVLGHRAALYRIGLKKAIFCETGVGPRRKAGARRREAGSKDFSAEKYF